jgi:hypothetical protein
MATTVDKASAQMAAAIANRHPQCFSTNNQSIPAMIVGKNRTLVHNQIGGGVVT